MAGSSNAARPGRLRLLAFVLLMLGLTVLFIALGTWQIKRLGEKEALIARIEARVDGAPQPAPPASEWPTLEDDEIEYTPLSLSGHYLPDQTIRVFTSLAAGGRDRVSGAGYWLMDPFELDGGGVVLVNRGFVPMESDMPPPEAGEIALTGLARVSEPAGLFTPEPDSAQRIEWVRDIDRLAALLPADVAPLAPFTLDLPAGPPGTLPQGGETVLTVSNNHLGYALTWFGFAVITPVMLVAWIWRERRKA